MKRIEGSVFIMKKVYETPAIEEVVFDTENVLAGVRGSCIEDGGEVA